MILKVCVGSSCHLKGSYDVIEQLKLLIKEYNLESEIDIAASFCYGECQNSVNLNCENDILHNFNKENAREKFVNEVLPKLNLNK